MVYSHVLEELRRVNILAKNFLTKIILAFIVLFSFSSPYLKTIIAKESYSNLFIKITDANTAIKNNEQDKAKKLIDKILTYRIFENTTDFDKLGKMDKSLSDIHGELLLVSQFTLMANTKNGRRPDFAPAMHPKQAKLLFNDMIDYAKQIYPNIATGEFGADMQVFSINDGPINFLLEI